MSESLYSKYVRERLGKHVVESEKGFATFSINSDVCYIEDIYVLPELRKSGYGTHIESDIEKIAKSKGCKTLLVSIVPSANKSTESLLILIARGYKVYKSENDMVYLVKEIA